MNSLPPERYGSDFKGNIFKIIIANSISCSHCEVAPMWNDEYEKGQFIIGQTKSLWIYYISTRYRYFENPNENKTMLIGY